MGRLLCLQKGHHEGNQLKGIFSKQGRKKKEREGKEGRFSRKSSLECFLTTSTILPFFPELVDTSRQVSETVVSIFRECCANFGKMLFRWDSKLGSVKRSSHECHSANPCLNTLSLNTIILKTAYQKTIVFDIEKRIWLTT